MNKNLALEISKVTEAAALACFNTIGCGDKIHADQKAVNAMRYMLNQTAIDGEIVIGEGEIDEAPMLYIGEKVGLGGDKVDIAIDPIDGTRMIALGQDNAVSVIVVSEHGKLLKAPDMYMEKLMVSSSGKGCVDLDKTIEENVINLAKQLNKEVSDVCVMTLAKPRHEKVIQKLHKMGVKVTAIPDGDVEGSILVAMPNSGIDMFYGIGGAPEGVISGAIIRAMDGDMQARLVTRSDAKGANSVNDEYSQMETNKCMELGIDINKTLKLDDLVNTDNVIISVTGITNGTLLKPVNIEGNIGQTNTLLIRGKTKTIRKIESIHHLDCKDEEIYKLVKE